MQPGDIYRHEAFYIDDSGKPATKYLILLAVPQRHDIVARLLTSRSHGRPETPPCYHGLPYGGYFLGAPGQPLTEKTWVDLRPFDDLDPIEFLKREQSGILVRVHALPAAVLCAVLDCVANAEDTTRHQERQLRDALATLR